MFLWVFMLACVCKLISKHGVCLSIHVCWETLDHLKCASVCYWSRNQQQSLCVEILCWRRPDETLVRVWSSVVQRGNMKPVTSTGLTNVLTLCCPAAFALDFERINSSLAECESGSCIYSCRSLMSTELAVYFLKGKLHIWQKAEHTAKYFTLTKASLRRLNTPSDTINAAKVSAPVT